MNLIKLFTKQEKPKHQPTQAIPESMHECEIIKVDFKTKQVISRNEILTWDVKAA